MQRNSSPRARSSGAGRRLGAERLLTAATSAQEAAQLARLRFDSGVTDFLIVLDAEREVLSNRDQLAQAQTDTATALVSVYRALGGGWAGQ
jgi:outer membrane protein, multidrug efflux system